MVKWGRDSLMKPPGGALEGRQVRQSSTWNIHSRVCGPPILLLPRPNSPRISWGGAGPVRILLDKIHPSHGGASAGFMWGQGDLSIPNPSTKALAAPCSYPHRHQGRAVPSHSPASLSGDASAPVCPASSLSPHLPRKRHPLSPLPQK